MNSPRAIFLMTARRIVVLVGILLSVGILRFEGQSRQTHPKGAFTINGITFKIPKGYRFLPAQPTEQSAILSGKYNDGIFFAVSPGPTPKDPSELIKFALKQLYPKESEAYSWKELPQPNRLSKLEVSGLAANGYNGSQMIKVVFRHVTIGEKIVTVGEINELAHGPEAKERFEGNMEAISLGLCNVFVETIFPLTREKADPKNPPCELVADVETIKPIKP